MPQWETHEPGVGTMLILKPYGRRFTSVRARVQAKCGDDLRHLETFPLLLLAPGPNNSVFLLHCCSISGLPPRPQTELHQTRAAATPRASLPCLSYRLLISAHHAEPFKHAILCRSPTATAVNDTMVRRYSPHSAARPQKDLPSLTPCTGKSGTTPFTSATSPRRRKTSSDASTFST
jgi:hypothetical protein